MEILSGDFGSMGRLAISLNGLKHIKLNLLIVIALSLHTHKINMLPIIIIIIIIKVTQCPESGKKCTQHCDK